MGFGFWESRAEQVKGRGRSDAAHLYQTHKNILNRFAVVLSK
jgi:hypothetical protein